jgi:hypothetical protein
MESLDTLIKILGWTLFVGPIFVSILLSGYMVWGAAKDDEVIMGLVLAGMSSVGIGIAVLAFVYFTDFSIASMFGG